MRGVSLGTSDTTGNGCRSGAAGPRRTENCSDESPRNARRASGEGNVGELGCGGCDMRSLGANVAQSSISPTCQVESALTGRAFHAAEHWICAVLGRDTTSQVAFSLVGVDCA